MFLIFLASKSVSKAINGVLQIKGKTEHHRSSSEMIHITKRLEKRKFDEQYEKIDDEKEEKNVDEEKNSGNICKGLTFLETVKTTLSSINVCLDKSPH